jgi:rhodanese-related sulfurtransferase
MPLEEIEGRLAELMISALRRFYRRSGDKTKELSELAEQGVGTAYLEGGLLAWEAAGLPIERPD